MFWRGEPMTTAELVGATGRGDAEVQAALADLNRRLENSGLVLLSEGDKLALGTHPAAADLISRFTTAEFSKELSRASSETLAIILYQGPVARAAIDYIRGVNSGFILRHLLIRGLIEKVENPADKRSWLYRPTIDLLSFLGITKIEDLPEYQELRAKIQQIKEL